MQAGTTPQPFLANITIVTVAGRADLALAICFLDLGNGFSAVGTKLGIV